MKHMNKTEIPQNRCYDIIIRLYNELPKFNAFHLIELTEFCVDSIRQGDPKCIGYSIARTNIKMLLLTICVLFCLT